MEAGVKREWEDFRKTAPLASLDIAHKADECKISVLRLIRKVFRGAMVKMRDWPTESKAIDSSLVEPDRTAGRKLSLTTKRETTVRKADQLIIYFGLLFQCMRLYHVYIV